MVDSEREPGKLKSVLLTYRGHDTWAKERIGASAARGTWTQAVFQVDDSPHPDQRLATAQSEERVRYALSRRSQSLF